MTDPMDLARQMMRRLDDIDDLFSRQEQERDYSEKLGAAAWAEAEGAKVTATSVQRLTQRIAKVLAVGLLLYTPLIAYGAVWMHERVRNDCYPVASPVTEPWFCGLFPGTNHPHHPGEHP